MAVPTSRRDLLHRTNANLDHIEQLVASQREGGKDVTAFETTQLVNSFLVTVLQHWDELERDWSQLGRRGLSWPAFTHTQPPQQSMQCLGKIRDALAHGLFAIEGENGEIAALHLWTCPDGKNVDWSATISVKHMREILETFVRFAEGRRLPFRPKKVKGDQCP